MRDKFYSRQHQDQTAPGDPTKTKYANKIESEEASCLRNYAVPRLDHQSAPLFEISGTRRTTKLTCLKRPAHALTSKIPRLHVATLLLLLNVLSYQDTVRLHTVLTVIERPTLAVSALLPNRISRRCRI